MTVSTVVDHNDYTGNGVTTSFPYTFRIFKKTDLKVSVIDLSENITVLVLDTDYTVTNAGGYSGGSVVLTMPLANGWKISVARELAATQETDLRNQGKFFAEVHEDAFDKLTMLIQQVVSMFRLALRKPSNIANWYDALNNYIRNLHDPRDPQDAATKSYVDTTVQSGDSSLNQKIDANFARTLRVPESSVPMLASAVDRANKVFAWDNSGQPINIPAPSGTATEVFIELAKPTGAGLIGYADTNVGEYLDEVNPQKTESGFEASSSTSRHSLITSDISTSDIILIPSYYQFEGIGFGIGKESQPSYRVISKTGNATTTLINQDKPADTRDAIMAIDPVWVNGRWPQETLIKNISLYGDSSSPNAVGLWIFQGSYFSIENLSTGYCKNAIYIADSWVSNFKGCKALNGSFVVSRGTSQRWEGCFANGDSGTRGAYSFNDLTYSTLISCAADHCPRTAYFFNTGCEMTLVSCGSEFAVATDTGLGSMIAGLDNNKLTIIGYKGVPTANQTTPLISIGNNSSYSIQNWESNSVNYPNTTDISVNGDNSIIVVENSIFSGGRFLPVVQFRGDHPTSFVVVKWKGNEYIYKSPTGGGTVTAPEYKYRSSTFTPALRVDNAVSNITYSLAAGNYKKTGNVITVNFEIAVSGLGTASSTGVVSVDLSPIPYSPADNVSVQMQVSNAVTYTSSGGGDLNSGGNQIFPISSTAVNMRVSNLQVGTRIKGSVTFGVNGTSWN